MKKIIILATIFYTLTFSSAASAIYFNKEQMLFYTEIHLSHGYFNEAEYYIGTQDWNAIDEGKSEEPKYKNFIVSDEQVKRINFDAYISDTIVSETESATSSTAREIAHVWFTRNLTDSKKPAFNYYPWLANNILQKNQLQWKKVPLNATYVNVPFFITPYYKNKWILHYTFIRNNNGVSALQLPQEVDDYTVEQFAITK